MRVAFCALLVAASLSSQQEPAKQEPTKQAAAEHEEGRPKRGREPRFRIGAGVAIGDADLDSDTYGNDAGAGSLFGLEFEFIGERRIGGGLRFETWTSDELITFVAQTETTTTSFFAHFTYGVDGDGFAMPMRAGVLAHVLSVDTVSSGEDDARSLGPYLEIAPELTLLQGRRSRWTLYAELGAGFAFTEIDVASSTTDFDSDTLFYGAEIGTRLRYPVFEAGLAWIARYQDTDESDLAGGTTFPSFDLTFRGLLFSIAFRF